MLSCACLKYKESFEESILKEVDVAKGGNKMYMTFKKDGNNVVYMDTGADASFLIKYKNCKQQNCFNTNFFQSITKINQLLVSIKFPTEC